MKINLYRRWLSVGFSLIILLMLGSPVVGVSADGASPPVISADYWRKIELWPGNGCRQGDQCQLRRTSEQCAGLRLIHLNARRREVMVNIRSPGSNPGGHLLTATADKFNSDSRWMGVVAGESATQNFALSPVFTSENVALRIVLTWDPTPTWPIPIRLRQLGQRFRRPYVAGGDSLHGTFLRTRTTEEIVQTIRMPAWRWITSRDLDPETVAIRKLENATYYYGVLNYYQGYPGVPPMTGTSAQVQVYNENGLLYTFKVPSTGDGDFWYVFSMASDGNLAVFTERNCITSFSDDTPPSCP